jgi:translation initiation factor 2 beta subunit (eIF-2beta)/eIF-5
MPKHWVNFTVTLTENVWVDAETPEKALEKAESIGWLTLTAGYEEIVQSVLEYLEVEECAHNWHRNDSCGAYVCTSCFQHANVNRETQEVIQTFVRCICGWAQDGGNGRQQLIEMGENLEEDY